MTNFIKILLSVAPVGTKERVEIKSSVKQTVPPYGSTFVCKLSRLDGTPRHGPRMIYRVLANAVAAVTHARYRSGLFSDTIGENNTQGFIHVDRLLSFSLTQTTWQRKGNTIYPVHVIGGFSLDRAKYCVGTILMSIAITSALAMVPGF